MNETTRRVWIVRVPTASQNNSKTKSSGLFESNRIESSGIDAATSWHRVWFARVAYRATDTQRDLCSPLWVHHAAHSGAWLAQNEPTNDPQIERQKKKKKNGNMHKTESLDIAHSNKRNVCVPSNTITMLCQLNYARVRALASGKLCMSYRTRECIACSSSSSVPAAAHCTLRLYLFNFSSFLFRHLCQRKHRNLACYPNAHRFS